MFRCIICHVLNILFPVLLVVLIGFALGGCAATGSTQSLTPVCTALGPPHAYNSHTLTSAIHAGPKLAPRLARDNSVGTQLRCPGY
jgi:hypothetical protein